MRIIIMSGELHPRDGVPGCKFTVTESEPENGLDCVRVSLTSPYEPYGIVDEATVCIKTLGDWLFDRVDY